VEFTVALSGIGSNHIDTYIVRTGSTYHAFTKNETAKYIEYGTASSLTAPTRSRRPATGPAGAATVRAPRWVQLDNGGWRIFFDGYGDGTYYYSDSYDTFATWSAPTALITLSGTARHFTVHQGDGVRRPEPRDRRHPLLPVRQLHHPLLAGAVRPAQPAGGDQLSTTALKQASTFTVVAGLADASGFSLRDSAGNYLRHYDFRGRFDANDGTTTFAGDATFYARTGATTGSLRFESYNYPATTCATYNYQLRVDPTDGTDLFRTDSSFVPVTAWA